MCQMSILQFLIISITSTSDDGVEDTILLFIIFKTMQNLMLWILSSAWS
jgi:hypothetical protein